ncbi:unnamed protein product [Absidia cylindrospora]
MAEHLHDFTISKLSSGEQVTLSDFLGSVDFSCIDGEVTRNKSADKDSFSLDSYKVNWHELNNCIRKYKSVMGIENATTNVQCQVANAVESVNIFQEPPVSTMSSFLLDFSMK